MGRRAYYDTDQERLPEGIRRVGYDADTQTYLYVDEQGRPWEGNSGAHYGRLHRANTEPRKAAPTPSNAITDKRIQRGKDDNDAKEEKDATDSGSDDEPKKGPFKRLRALSKAAISKLIPKRSESSSNDDSGEAASQKKANLEETVVPTVPRRRAKTMSNIVDVARGVKYLLFDGTDTKLGM